MKKIAIVFITLVQAFAAAHAQQATPTPEPSRRPTWRADMPAGSYIVLLSAITSISRHEYVVDGAARVSEVNISALGSDSVRFYFIEPNTPQMPGGIGQSGVEMLKEKAQEAVSRAGGDDVWQKVVKNYPATTHAHTVEYRLVARESLNKLFESLENSWKSGRSATFKP